MQPEGPQVPRESRSLRAPRELPGMLCVQGSASRLKSILNFESAILKFPETQEQIVTFLIANKEPLSL
jgi:hypothetical protein